jgi:hypothetical protein
MKKRSFLFLLAVVACTLVSAQSVSEKYEMETIYLSTGKYIKNGEKYPLGLFSQHLKKEMKVSPEAVIEFRRYEKKRNWGMVFIAAGAGSYLTGLALDSASDEVRGGLLIGGLGLTLTSVPFGIQSMNSYHKAIWLRNGAVLK